MKPISFFLHTKTLISEMKKKTLFLENQIDFF